MVKKAKKPMCFGDKIFNTFNNLILLFVLLITAYPLIYICSASISSPSDIISGKMWLYPVNINFEAYKAVFRASNIMNGYLNSLFYTVLYTVISVILTIMAAYPLSRPDLKCRSGIMTYFIITMYFSGGMIPTYLLVNSLGIMDTIWAIILPGALSVWNLLVAKTFFETTIPKELIEAAKIDGCDDFTFIIKVVLPLSGAIIAVISLYYATGQWNSYFNAMIYLRDRNLYPLQLVLRQILVMNEMDTSMMMTMNTEEMQAREAARELLKYALIVVSSLPVMIIYPFVQKYFTQGVMLGAVKG